MKSVNIDDLTYIIANNARAIAEVIISKAELMEVHEGEVKAASLSGGSTMTGVPTKPRSRIPR